MADDHKALVASPAPDRIWAKLDRATVYMDGSSALVARTREFHGSTAYVAENNLDLLVAAMPDEDDIEQAITDSIDLDWTPRDAAKAVMRLLQTGVNGEGLEGEHLETCCPFDPKNDPKNENIDSRVSALQAEVERLTRERDEAREALKPFAEVADDFDADGRDLADSDGIYANKAGDFRRARAVLGGRDV